jgi:hypothetical protein
MPRWSGAEAERKSPAQHIRKCVSVRVRKSCIQGVLDIFPFVIFILSSFLVILSIRKIAISML